MASVKDFDIFEELRYYKQEVQRLRHSCFSFDQIKGNSLAILEAKNQAWNIAATQTPVLLSGELGTGRRLFAHAIHGDSPQQEGAFYFFNCQANPEDIKLQLLDEAAGLLTQISRVKASFVPKGALVLYEINALPQDTQTKLAQRLEPFALSAKQTMHFPRLIATISKNTHEENESPVLSEALNNLFTTSLIHLPPLRTRLEDIPAITHRFISELNQFAGTTITGINNSGMDLMMQYTWPGNVSELKSMVERAGLDAQSGIIGIENFYLLQDRIDDIINPPTLKQASMQAEKAAIIKALHYSKGNKKMASETLGITRTSLYNKLKELDIDG